MAENNSKRLIRDGFSASLSGARKLSSRAWELLKSYPLYFAILIMASYALWDARTPVTMIAPFQLPKKELPFTGDMVADSVQDGLKSIRNEIEQDKRDTGLRSSDTGLPDLRNILVPDFWRVQEPPRITVEIKGVSYERVLSVLRALLHTETLVSGDVIVSADNKFTLVARASDAGPWETDPRPVSTENLKQASKELAQKIVAAQDPTLAGVALLKDGQIDQGLAQLSRAHSLKPADVRLKLNLCMGFAANRRYQDAIECYKEVRSSDPSSLEVQYRLAQAHYLKGDREKAIEIYKDLDKEGYRQALLGFGEAKDDTGDPKAALDAYDKFLATETQPRNQAIAHVKKSLAYSHLQNHTAAMEEYREALELAPRDVLILVNEGLELAQSEDLDAGIAQIQSAVDGNQDSDSLPFALLQLGSLLEKKGDWTGAIERYSMAAQLRSTYVEAHLSWRTRWFMKGRQRKLSMNTTRSPGLVVPILSADIRRSPVSGWRMSCAISATTMAPPPPTKLLSISRPTTAQLTASWLSSAPGRGISRRPFAMYGAALVPAKLQELNDSECLVIVDHVLDESFGRRSSAHPAQAVAELIKIKDGMKLAAQLTPNALPPGAEKPKVVVQAVLHRPE